MAGYYQVILATALFLIVYAIIVSEKIHRMVAALLGATLLVVLKIINLEKAVHAIDFNTLGFLIGMMIVVGIIRNTGVFEYLAVKAVKKANGEPIRIIASLSLITAVLSALLDNVTTVLLIVPVTFALAKMLKLNPAPFLTAEIIASNIGGAATSIGDPPNIMIGSAAKLGFMDFAVNLTPVIIIIYTVTIFCIQVIYRKQLITQPELQVSVMSINEFDEIKDYPLLRKCLFVLSLTMLGFVLHQYIHVESSVVALMGASLLLLLSREDPEHSLQAVEWPVIFFFIGLFVLVGGLEEVGVIEALAKWSLTVTGGNIVFTGMLMLWLSAIASAFVDNIPFVATMIPLIQDMGRLGGLTDLNLIWWSLSLGACLGGNGTIIGASANVVVIGMAEKRNYHISFTNYMKIAFPLMMMSILVSTCYLLFWHFFCAATAIGVTFVIGTAIALLSKFAGRKITGKTDKELRTS